MSVSKDIPGILHYVLFCLIVPMLIGLLSWCNCTLNYYSLVAHLILYSKRASGFDMAPPGAAVIPGTPVAGFYQASFLLMNFY